LSLTEKDIVRFLSLSKYLGYDIATASKKGQNEKKYEPCRINSI
jgi:hypothetical protein